MEKENKNATGKNDVLIRYSIAAPRELVFKAWTDPSLLPLWYAPDGCTVEFKRLDIRTGGEYHACIYNPEFGECWSKGVYKEIIAPERIVYSSIIADEEGNTISAAVAEMDPDWPQETLITVSFAEEEGKTIITLQQTVDTALVKKTGAHPSWLKMFGRLENLIRETVSSS